MIMKLDLNAGVIAMFVIIFLPIKAYLALFVIFISIFSYYGFVLMNKPKMKMNKKLMKFTKN